MWPLACTNREKAWPYDIIWISSFGVCAAVFILLSGDAVLMHAKYMLGRELEREKVKPQWISSHPLRSDDEYFMGRFQNCSFPFYLFSSHGGICGRGVFSISVLCTYFLWPAICPVYICSLTCLSLLSTVEKDYIHKKEQITIQGQKKKTTTDCPLQYNLVV